MFLLSEQTPWCGYPCLRSKLHPFAHCEKDDPVDGANTFMKRQSCNKQNKRTSTTKRSKQPTTSKQTGSLVPIPRCIRRKGKNYFLGEKAPQTSWLLLEWTATSPVQGDFCCHEVSRHSGNMWIGNLLHLEWNSMAGVAVVTATVSSRQAVMRRVSPEKRAFPRDGCPLNIRCLSALASHFDLLPDLDIYHLLKSPSPTERWTARRDTTTKKRLSSLARDRNPSVPF